MMCWCGDDHEPTCPTCDKCGAPISTGMMAVICPHREACEFWPDNPETVAFCLQLRGEVA